MLARQLARRFGPLSAATEARLTSAGVDDLARWTERVLDATTLDAVFGDG